MHRLLVVLLVLSLLLPEEDFVGDVAVKSELFSRPFLFFGFTYGLHLWQDVWQNLSDDHTSLIGVEVEEVLLYQLVVFAEEVGQEFPVLSCDFVWGAFLASTGFQSFHVLRKLIIGREHATTHYTIVFFRCKVNRNYYMFSTFSEKLNELSEIFRQRIHTNYFEIVFLQELQELIEFFSRRIFELYLNTNYTDIFFTGITGIY